MTIMEYLVCRLEISGWINVETTRGDGKEAPDSPVILGCDRPVRNI